MLFKDLFKIPYNLPKIYYSIRLTIIVMSLLLVGCNENNNSSDKNTEKPNVSDGVEGEGSDFDDPSLITQQPPLTTFEEEIIDRILSRQYLDNTFFTPMNRDPYSTALNATQDISLYVSRLGSSLYALIDPDKDGSNIVLPEGTMIVREVWDKDGSFLKYTVMVKREEGYFPESGNFYFAAIDPQGNFIKDANGQRQSGPLASCSVCHIPRSKDGFLFGVPKSTKAVFETELNEQRLEQLAVASVFNEAYKVMMRKANRVPVISSMSQFSLVNTYVSNAVYNEYRKITPDDSGSNAQLPKESVIIREVKDLRNPQKTKITVMIKGPEGYHPGVGDYYFAVLNTDGEFIKDEDGNALSGALSECAVCHIPRNSDDFLFGLPKFYK